MRCRPTACVVLAAAAAVQAADLNEAGLFDEAEGFSVATVFQNHTGRRTKEVIVHKSLCGISKRPLSEDYVRRHCLRQCRIEDDGFIRPTFSEWERFCKETSSMEDWDAACSEYLCCTFGCGIYGGDRSVCENIDVSQRRAMLTETTADLMSGGITQEQRCELQKCHAYCARRSFDTCREQMFSQACQASNPHLYGCDVDCSGAPGRTPAIFASLAAAAWWISQRR
eukprot:TRINITY_DN8782_c0_g1_i1.p1 TRINITY_DN8782_c0_g1~~TRINITY_DN8782_c0_g1_i1.p1  ORF type:complete len:226 (+),score=45.88 TRINITY_DN8782_c0_g1_i1:178-855(+)